MNQTNELRTPVRLLVFCLESLLKLLELDLEQAKRYLHML